MQEHPRFIAILHQPKIFSFLFAVSVLLSVCPGFGSPDPVELDST